MYSPIPGKIFFPLPLVLNAKKIHDIRGRQNVFDTMGNRNAQVFKLARDKRARSNQRDARAELQQAEDVRTRDAAEQNVADDRDMQSGDRAFSFADRVEIEQSLSRDVRARRRRR